MRLIFLTIGLGTLAGCRTKPAPEPESTDHELYWKGVTVGMDVLIQNYNGTLTNWDHAVEYIEAQWRTNRNNP